MSGDEQITWDKIYEGASALRAELATFNVKVVCEMARDDGPHDLTPFNLMVVAAIKAMGINVPDDA